MRTIAAAGVLALAACGGGGSSGPASTPPAPATPTPQPVLVRDQNSSQPFQSSASSPGRLNAGNTATMIVYEPGYSGSFTETTIPVSLPSGSKVCVNADLVGSGGNGGQYLFIGTTLNQVADPGCLFPQTVDVHLTDSAGRSGDLFVKVVTSSNQ
ncbi:MAG TPA: hypothetical protein VGC96_03340 [Candidatus Elarobacter sp.]